MNLDDELLYIQGMKPEEARKHYLMLCEETTNPVKQTMCFHPEENPSPQDSYHNTTLLPQDSYNL